MKNYVKIREKVTKFNIELYANLQNFPQNRLSLYVSGERGVGNTGMIGRLLKLRLPVTAVLSEAKK